MFRLGLNFGLNGVVSAASGPAPATDDTADMTVRIAADNDTMLTLTGSNIDAFLDQSGNGRTFSNTGEGMRWTRSAAQLGTLGVAVAGGDYNRYLTAAGVTLSTLFGASAGTIVTVARCDDVSATRYLFSQSSPAHIRLETSAGPNLVFRYNNSGTGNVTVSRSITLSQWFIAVARWDGTSFYLSIDGGTEASALGTTPVAMTSRVAIVGDGGTAGFWRDRFAHLSCYNVCKSETQVANIVSYLQDYYGL